MKTFSRSAGRTVILLALLFFGSRTARCQWPNDPEVDQLVQQGIENVYNFEFEKAEAQFARVIELRPDHPAGYFFRAMIQWERISCNFDDESLDGHFYALLHDIEEMCDKRLDKDPNDITALFFKGGSVGFEGRLRANRGQWLKAANDGLVALPLVRRAYEIQPNNYDILLGMGIYNYYMDIIPDRYPVVKPILLFFPSGNRKKGLQQLWLAAEHAKYANVEASYFLVQNYFMYEKDFAKAQELSRKLHERFPNNSNFYRFYGRCLVSTGHLGEAHDVFTDILKRAENKQYGFDIYDVRESNYYIGKEEFLAGDFDGALQHLSRCDVLSKKLDQDNNSGFMVLANLLIGMIYDERNQRDYAVTQYKKVLDMKEYEGSHAEAKKYIQNPFSRTK
jgi:tetratricopeptide (TPR) repeat protein